jgi:hypothetical protein
MKREILTALCWVIIATVPVAAQEKLYPVRDKKDFQVLVTSDRSAFVLERGLQFKLIIGFPSDDNLAFVPDTNAPLVMLWLRIQNLSQRPLSVSASTFTSTDEQNKVYPALTPEDAANRIVAGASGGSLGTKALRGISLGKAAGKPADEQLREDVLRYSLQATQIPAGSVREGLIFFEAPPQKKFNVNVVLGELWSRPLLFSTSKQK